MKKSDLTTAEKIAELRLDISNPNTKGKVFILLEGSSDVRLFRKLYDEDNCKIETVPGGKSELKNAIKELSPDYGLIIGIRDADFLHLEGKKQD